MSLRASLAPHTAQFVREVGDDSGNIDFDILEEPASMLIVLVDGSELLNWRENIF